jgi:hypothetical protein
LVCLKKAFLKTVFDKTWFIESTRLLCIYWC